MAAPGDGEPLQQIGRERPNLSEPAGHYQAGFALTVLGAQCVLPAIFFTEEAMRGRTRFAQVASALAMLLLPACTESADQAPSQGAAPPPQAEAPLTRLAQDPELQWGPCPDIFPAGCEITVLHGDPARPNADVFLRVPGGYRIPPHSHTSVERMILVTGELNVQYQGAPASVLTAGEYAFGPAGLPHEANCASTDACTLFIAFEGPVDALPFEGSIE